MQYRRAKIVSDGTDIFLCFPAIVLEKLTAINKTITVSQSPTFTSVKRYIEAQSPLYQSSVAVTKGKTSFELKYLKMNSVSDYLVIIPAFDTRYSYRLHVYDRKNAIWKDNVSLPFFYPGVERCHGIGADCHAIATDSATNKG